MVERLRELEAKLHRAIPNIDRTGVGAGAVALVTEAANGINELIGDVQTAGAEGTAPPEILDLTKSERSKVREALALHRSMAECGESPSDVSRKVYREAMVILDTEPPVPKPITVQFLMAPLPPDFRESVMELITQIIDDVESRVEKSGG